MKSPVIEIISGQFDEKLDILVEAIEFRKQMLVEQDEK